jgi:lipoprotein signal peptidase
MGQILQQAIPYIKWGAIMLFGLAIMIGLMYYFMVYKKRRRWHIEIHEQKTDGRLHSIGRDVLEERTKDWGTKTFYFLKNRRKVALPPVDCLVDRMKNGKEEVDYIQIERQLFPTDKDLGTNYNVPSVNKQVQTVYDRLMTRIFNMKKEEVRERYMYLPVHKALVANMTFKPIPYDVQLTVQRQVQIANEFFKSKGSFFEKYGTIIAVGLIIVLVIVAIVMTYDFVSTHLELVTGKADAVVNSLDRIAQGLGMNSEVKPVA